MDSHEIKLKARKFVKEFDLCPLTYTALKSAVERQGYAVVSYRHLSNDEDTAALIRALKLSELVMHSKGFTYADSNHRIVFLHEDLSEAEKRIVLSHEAGHIYLGHMSSSPVIGRDVREEYEASEFSHFLLNPGGYDRTRYWLRTHRRAAALAALAVVICAAAAILFAGIHAERRYYGEYYITETGNRYHKKDCIFVKDKTNAHRMTTEEFESGEYEACGICLP